MTKIYHTKYTIKNIFIKELQKNIKKILFHITKILNFQVSLISPFKTHNSIITSSVVVERKLLEFIGGFRPFATKNDYAPDYDCWLGLLRLTNCDYIDEPLFYYDSLHGSGRVW